MESIFGPEGLIAQAHPEYEHRPGQIEMARVVMRALKRAAENAISLESIPG